MIGTELQNLASSMEFAIEISKCAQKYRVKTRSVRLSKIVYILPYLFLSTLTSFCFVSENILRHGTILYLKTLKYNSKNSHFSYITIIFNKINKKFLIILI